MVHGLTDQVSTLIEMNHALAKVTAEMGRMAVGAGHANTQVRDFTEQLAHFHWAAGALLDSFPFPRHGHRGGYGAASYSAFNDVEGSILRNGRGFTPSSFSGGGGAGAGRPTMPPSMRPRKYSGMGAYTDFFPHVGAEFSTGYFMQAFMKHGTPAMLPHVAKLHAHLQGGREMLWDEFSALMHAAAAAKGKGGRPAYSLDFLKKLEQAYRMSRDKHEQAQSHQAGLRMRGKLGSDATDNSLRESRRAQQRRRGRFGHKLAGFLNETGEFGRHAARAGLMYGGVALQNASPDVFATLSGSFQLLAAQIGTTLTPHAIEASKALQDAARGFESLDEKTKKWIGVAAIAGTSLAGLIALSPYLVSLGRLFSLLGGGKLLRSGGRLLGAGASAAVNHPWLTAGAASATAGYWYGSHVNNTLNQHRSQGIQSITEQTHLTSLSDLKKSPEYQNVLQMPRDKALAHLRHQRDEASEERWAARDEVERLRGERDGSGQHFSNMGFLGSAWANVRGVYNKLFDRESIVQAQEKEASTHGRVAHFSELIDLVKYGEKGFDEHRRQSNPKFKEMQDNALIQANNLLIDRISRVQPGYYGIEDMYKKIQLQVLSESPLQQEILRIQQKQYDALMLIVGNTTKPGSEGRQPVRLP